MTEPAPRSSVAEAREPDPGNRRRFDGELWVPHRNWREQRGRTVAQAQRAEAAERALVAACAAVLAYASALRATGWNDSGGPCWCLRAAEETGEPHRPQCARARLLLGHDPGGAPRELLEPLDRELPPAVLETIARDEGDGPGLT